ncbi:MAG: hypothetical protein K2R98_20260 [Gemmataceae bacterium]|nr:hypothetical protein [Gemmataceae bacterium]
MRTLCRLVLTFLALSLAADAALSQAAGSKLFGLSGLARQKGVQDELKMTKKQADAVPKIIKDVNARFKDDLAELEELKGAERFKKQSEISKAAGEETDKALAAVLSADQMTRLKQIQVQQRGPYAFSEADVVEALKLSKDQQKKVREIEAEYQKALGEASKLTDANERTKKVAAAIKDALDKDLALLTDEQKKAWKTLTGDPYKGK